MSHSKNKYLTPVPSLVATKTVLTIGQSSVKSVQTWRVEAIREIEQPPTPARLSLRAHWCDLRMFALQEVGQKALIYEILVYRR